MSYKEMNIYTRSLMKYALTLYPNPKPLSIGFGEYHPPSAERLVYTNADRGPAYEKDFRRRAHAN